jgi:hypothetical protein
VKPANGLPRSAEHNRKYRTFRGGDLPDGARRHSVWIEHFRHRKTALADRLSEGLVLMLASNAEVLQLIDSRRLWDEDWVGLTHTSSLQRCYRTAGSGLLTPDWQRREWNSG